MRLALVLGGLSVAIGQELILLPVAGSSSQRSLSSSLSLSTRNVSSSATVTPSSAPSASTPKALSTSSFIATPSTISTLSTISKSSVIFPSKTQSLILSASQVSNSSNIAIATPVPTAYVNPWAGNFSSPIHAHGTGSAYALQCQNAWFSYTSINIDYIKASASQFYSTSVIRSTTVYEIHTYFETSYYTLCDGHPRVITSTPTQTSTTTLAPSTTTVLVQRVGWDSYAAPSCTISWDDCQGLWSRYASASSVYNAISFGLANTVVQLGSGASYWMVNGVTTVFPTPSPQEISLGTEYIHKYYQKDKYLVVTTPPPGGLVCDCGLTMTAGGPAITIKNTIDFTNTPYTPSCRTAKPTCTADQRCQIGGDEVEIYWFPPQTNVTRDMCATAPTGPITSRPPTNFTWTPITTGPYAVMPGNTTWFSGNVYVSLNRINAMCNWSGTSVEVGSTHQGEVLTMAPSELFSQRAFPTTIGDRSGLVEFEPYAYSFNFNDLISPYPWSAWVGGFDCVAKTCSTMSGSYNPWIAVPEAIRRLDPKWATCDLALYGLYDPPIALSTVGNIFATTTIPQVAGPKPTPGQSPPQSQVGPTNTPIKPGDPLPWQSDPGTPAPSAHPDDPGDPSIPNPDPKPGNPNLDPKPTPGNPDLDPKSTPDNPNSDPQPTPVNPNSDPEPTAGNPNSDPKLTPGQNDPPVPNTPDLPRPGLTPPPVVVVPDPTTIGTIASTPIVVNPTNPTRITIGTTVLTPGGPGITVGTGTFLSVADPGHLVISSPGAAAPSTINIPQPTGAGSVLPTAGVIFTLPSGEKVTATAILGEGQSGASSATSILISGTLLSANGPPITLPNGIILSEAPSGTGIVVIEPNSGATSTIPFSSVPGIGIPTANSNNAPGLNGLITPPPTALITLGGHVYTATSRSGSVEIPELGVTVSGGGPGVVVNGTTVSDGGEGTGVVVGTRTQTFVTPSATARGTGRGGGGGGGVFAGGAGNRGGRAWRESVALFGVAVMVIVF